MTQDCYVNSKSQKVAVPATFGISRPKGYYFGVAASFGHLKYASN